MGPSPSNGTPFIWQATKPSLVKVSKDGGKGKTFKFDYKKIPKSFEKKPTPKVPTSATAKTKAGRVKTKATYQAKRTASQARKFARNTATKAREAAATTRFGTGKPFPEASKAAKTSKAVKMSKYLKSLKPSTIAGGAVKGGISAGVEVGLERLGKHLVNRGFRQLEGKQKMSMKEYKALLDKRRAELDSRSTWWGGVKKKGTDTKKTETKSKDKKITNRRGRVVGTRKTDPGVELKGGKELSSSIRARQKKMSPWEVKKKVQPGNDLKVNQNNTKVENTKVVKQGGQGNQQRNQKKSDTPYWQSPRQKQEPAPKKKYTARDRMADKNRKIFGVNSKGEDRVTLLQQKHKEWKAARKAGTLKAWRKKWSKRRI